MKDARVEDVDRVSDSDNDEKDDECLANSGEKEMTIGIFPSHQSPIYLHLPTKQEKVSVARIRCNTFCIVLILMYLFRIHGCTT